MKKNHTFLLLSLSFICILTFSGFNKNECSDALYLQALGKLKEFTLIKDYRVNLKKKRKNDPIEMVYFPLTMTRGERYRFFGLQSAEYKGKLVINIYNNMKRENQIATTYNTSTQTQYESIEFLCHSTGNFCLALYFKDGEEGCGVGISSFKKE